jgi:hypothetical protein
MPASRLMNRLLCMLAVVSLLLAVCGPARPTATPPLTATTAPVSAPTSTQEFSETPTTLPTAAETPGEPPTPESMVSLELGKDQFEEPAVEVLPASHHAPIAPNLGNVRVPFVLPGAQRERLA